MQGVKGGAGGILDLLKASKQVAGLDSALRYFTRSFFILNCILIIISLYLCKICSYVLAVILNYLMIFSFIK